jgi:hypothetical protein
MFWGNDRLDDALAFAAESGAGALCGFECRADEFADRWQGSAAGFGVAGRRGPRG